MEIRDVILICVPPAVGGIVGSIVFKIKKIDIIHAFGMDDIYFFDSDPTKTNIFKTYFSIGLSASQYAKFELRIFQ